MKKFYSVKEAARIVGVSTNTIYKYLDEGSLKGKRLNSRGRFKIPFSEIAPYLATEASPGEKIGNKLTVFELWLWGSLAGLVLIYILWNLGRGVVGYKPSLLTDIGNSVWGYSGRTFSGFGSLISRGLPVQKPTNEAKTAKEIVSKPLIGIVPEGDIPDLSYKIQETEGRTTELYVNAQVLSAGTQRLIAKSNTLTSAELTDAIGEMLQLLGSLSDSSDKKTLFAEINWLAESWDFSTIDAIKRAGSNVSYILVSLQRQSLGAFTKPDLADLNNLVSEADLLQGLVGNIPDEEDKKTLYGNIKAVESLAQALDAKSQEIEKILESWNSYSLSEKEDTVKSVLSNTLSLNKLPKIEEAIFSQDLKNSLLSARGVLTANKIYLSQKAGKPVVATWTESENKVLKVLVVNPSASDQEAKVKYDEPFGTKVETSLILNAGEAKTLSFNLDDSKVASANSRNSTNPTATKGQVAGLASLNFQMQRIGLWTSIIIFVSSLLLLVIYLVGAAKEPLDSIIAMPSAHKSENKGLLKIPAIIITFLSKVASSITNLIVSIATSLKVGFLAIIHATTTFFVNIVSFVTKAISATITALLKIPGSIITFFSRVISLITDLIVSIATSVRQGFRAIIQAITTFFINIISAITKAIISIKTGLLTILVSVITFLSKTLSLTIKLAVSIVTGSANLVLSIATSLKHGFLAVIHTITTSFVKIISSIVTFVVNVISAITKGLISLKRGILTILISISGFLLQVLTLTANLIVAVATALKRGFLTTIHAVTTFIARVVSGITTFFVKIASLAVALVENTISAITGALIATVVSIRKILVSIVILFLRAVSLAAKTLAVFIRRFLRALISIMKVTEATLQGMNFQRNR